MEGQITAAHDSRPFDGLLDPKNTGSRVWAIPLIGQPATKRQMAKRGRISMVHFRKRKGGHCQQTTPKPTPRARRTVPRWSTSSPAKSIA